MAEAFFTNGIGAATGALAGTEKLPADLAAGGSESLTTQQIADLAISQSETLPNVIDSSVVNTISFTATGPEVAGARLSVLKLNGVLAGPATLTMPTAVAMVAAIPKAQVGETYTLRFVNNSTGAFAWTIAGNASVTVPAVNTVNNGAFREYQVVLVSLTAVALHTITPN